MSNLDELKRNWFLSEDKKEVNTKAINAGKCIICGNPIKLVVSRDNNKLPNIFVCPKCRYNKRIEKEGKRG